MSILTGRAPAPPGDRGPERRPPGPRGARLAGDRSASGSGTRVVRGGAAEIALTAVTIAAVCGLGRVFSGAEFLPPLLVAALASHAAAWGGRRMGLSAVAAAVVSGMGLVLTVAWVVEPHTLTLGLPLGNTWDALSRDLADAWDRFGVVRAPAEPVRGFIVAATVATWITGFLADSFAFRFRARLEALLPSFVLFVFGAMLGADRSRIAFAGLYVGAVLAFVVLSGARQAAPGAWLGGRSAEGEVALVRRGLAIALLVLLGGLAVGPNLPGAETSALLDWRDSKRRRPSSRVTVSPLVDIRSRLVQLSNVEVFAVRSDVASYWRLTSLDRFDGTIWSSLGSYRPAGERLPSDIGAGDAAQLVNQDFEIRGLNQIWLPAAFQPERLHGPAGVRYDRDSSSLLTDAQTSNGLRYRVASAQRRPTAEQLSAAPTVVPDDVAERYLALPGDFPPRVREEARRVTASSTTPYGAARALQDWFRSSFTYDLTVAAGHDQWAIERFLFVDRRGYCEQFAGAYAAMARSLGLPARVAVGFTPGETAGDGLFRVTGANAHAWPEVYIAGFGWMAFEPTPNRSVPGGESYTGVTAPAPDPATPPTTAPGVAQTAPAPTVPAPRLDNGQAVESSSDDDGGGPSRGVVAAGALVAFAALYAGGVPLARRALRHRRRTAAVAPDDRVLLAWQEAQEDLALAGLPRSRSETAAEYAGRAVQDRDLFAAPGAAVALEQLANDASAASFAPARAHEDQAEKAEAAAEAIHMGLQDQAGSWQKLKWALDPRPLRDLLRSAGR